MDMSELFFTLSLLFAVTLPILPNFCPLSTLSSHLIRLNEPHNARPSLSMEQICICYHRNPF